MLGAIICLLVQIGNADNIVLLAPSAPGLRMMLNTWPRFAKDYNLCLMQQKCLFSSLDLLPLFNTNLMASGGLCLPFSILCPD